jgi:hypothetical protein
VTVTRSTCPDGVYLGPPAMRGEAAFLLSYTDLDTYAVALDATGRETGRAVLAPTAASQLVDGGGGIGASLVVPPHAGPLVDSAGTVAFITPDGDIGIASATGVDVLGESVCPPAATASVADPSVRAVIAAHGGIPAPLLAPAGPSAFLVACPAGVVAKVTAARGH